MFNKIAKPIVDATLNGINGTIFAYGQTSSGNDYTIILVALVVVYFNHSIANAGKTHTMLGDEENPGIMILAVRQIFKDIESFQDRQFLLR